MISQEMLAFFKKDDVSKFQTLHLGKCMMYSRKIEVFKCQYAHFAHIHLSFGCTDEKMDLGIYLDTYRSKCQNLQMFKFENRNVIICLGVFSAYQNKQIGGTVEQWKLLVFEPLYI